MNEKTDYHRQQELLLATEKDTRILCVGDSFTAGFGASSKTASYPTQLKKILNDHSEEDQWEVLIYSPDTWLKVHSESQAELVALSLPLAEAVANGEAAGPEVADKLEAAADALDDIYEGESSMIERQCREMANEARDSYE